jgi:putative CocE/NonD family hydrolase
MKPTSLTILFGWLLSLTLSAEPGKQILEIPMRNGAKLAADLFLPADYSKEKYPDGLPTILIITPYNRERENAGELWRETMVRNGYAFIAQDMRGFHGSGGGSPGAARQGDGHDTIEWIATQPWSNGKVGMMGYSHLGAVQYETAVTTPPSLACAIPAQAPGNYYTDSYFPPKFRKADMETLLRGEFTSRTQQLINRRTRSRETSQISQINVPMIHSAGWFDFYKEGAIEMFNAIQKDGGPLARGTQKLIIGPWGHGTTQEENPGMPLTVEGGMTFPGNARFDWEAEVWMPWFDHWLKGKESAIMEAPAVRYYLMGATDDPDAPGNKWVAANHFPPESTPLSLYAHADKTLRATPPVAERESLSYTYDPRDPVPTVGRRHARIPVKGPHDQREVEGRPDVLVFTTAALENPIEIVGNVSVRLWASSDRVDTDFTAKVTDVYPDGRSMHILDSIVKARYRNTYLKEELLTPGEVYEFEIDLGYTAIALAPGHRLRLAISSSNFDRFDINPNTGEPIGDHSLTQELMGKRFAGYEARSQPQFTEALSAKNTIYLAREHPTQVILPVTSSPPSGQ